MEWSPTPTHPTAAFQLLYNLYFEKSAALSYLSIDGLNGYSTDPDVLVESRQSFPCPLLHQVPHHFCQMSTVAPHPSYVDLVVLQTLSSS